VSADPAWAHERIAEAIAEISRIERLLTTFSEHSETSAINRMAGIRPVGVSPETLKLIERSLRISALTDGAFDITYGSIDTSLWNFNINMTSLPDAGTARRSVHLINYRNVVIDAGASTVFLKKKDMRIGFGGIGKGYAAERAKLVMQRAGVASGIVNASGDLCAWGTQPGGKPWTAGISDPDDRTRMFSMLPVSGRAVATSGTYEKYAVIGGKKYSHTIDPRTGLPASGVRSATIISPNAEISDALATPVMVLGVKRGLSLINQLRHVECMVVDDDNQLHCSKGIQLTDAA
jgi:thiamine biosynthesis lipoprotein